MHILQKQWQCVNLFIPIDISIIKHYTIFVPFGVSFITKGDGFNDCLYGTGGFPLTEYRA